MSTSGISNVSHSYLQQALASAVQSAETSTNASANGVSAPASLSQADSTRLSPFAQLASVLQQLQQSDPTKYKQVTAQIATNLQSAAQTAQSQGNSGAANQLNQLATDFTNASQSGQLPNLQDLAQAVGASGGGHHHHHAQEASDSSTSSSSQSTQSTSTNPGAIILQTLANGGSGTK